VCTVKLLANNRNIAGSVSLGSIEAINTKSIIASMLLLQTEGSGNCKV